MQLTGALVGGLAYHGLDVEQINTGTWKVAVFGKGKGNAGKEHILQYATEMLGREPKRQDEADAICIARAGWLICQGLDSDATV
jgi:Holliday junction resolvasome RuvABC endonuclease subunit